MILREDDSLRDSPLKELCTQLLQAHVALHFSFCPSVPQQYKLSEAQIFHCFLAFESSTLTEKGRFAKGLSGHISFFVPGPRFPSKSGLMNKHIVKQRGRMGRKMVIITI
jgi:hypothetical protein